MFARIYSHVHGAAFAISARDVQEQEEVPPFLFHTYLGWRVLVLV